MKPLKSLFVARQNRTCNRHSVYYYFLFFMVSYVILFSSLCYATSSLYPGEQVLTVNNVETLIKFSKGDPNKPLIIFVPGDAHLARISYGYPNGKRQDFLEYWFHKANFSFLGISYPLDNPAYSKSYPAFTISEWGSQVATVAKKLIQQNHLSPHIVVLGWSMGGSIENVINEAATKQGLKVDLFIGLSAVPPLPYIMQSGIYSATKMNSKNGLAIRKPLYDAFINLLKEQNDYNGHEIIPKQLYLNEFVGDIPVALEANGYNYEGGKFLENSQITIKDSAVFNFATTPWLALIKDDAPSAAKIVLIDPASWNFLRSEMLYHVYLNQLNLAKAPQSTWLSLNKFFDTLPAALTLTVHGNHFFFVGEKGAKQTVTDVDILLNKTEQLKIQLNKILAF